MPGEGMGTPWIMLPYSPPVTYPSRIHHVSVTYLYRIRNRCVTGRWGMGDGQGFIAGMYQSSLILRAGQARMVAWEASMSEGCTGSW